MTSTLKFSFMVFSPSQFIALKNIQIDDGYCLNVQYPID